MNDAVKQYARAVAGAVRDHCANRYCVELGSVPNTDLDAIIATVPAPVMQHHAAPSRCPVCIGTGLVSRPSGVAGDQATWSSASPGPFPCRACDGKGLLPPDTTEPAKGGKS